MPPKRALAVSIALATPARAEQLEPATTEPQPSVQQVVFQLGIASPIGSIVDVEVQCGAPRALLFVAGGGVTSPLVDFHYDFVDTGKTVHSRDLQPSLKLGLGYRF